MSIGVPQSHWTTLREFDHEEKLGFVYCVSNLLDGRRYFGRKQFWNKRTSYAKYSTGRKYKKREWIESDWRDYRGSSEWLLADIDELGANNFGFEILSTFESKSGIATAEATLILCSNCLLAPERFYNRAAPSVRGKIQLPDCDLEEFEALRKWIRANT